MVLIPFTDAVIINPTIKLKKGNEYPFVDMASVSRDSRTVYALEKREYTGGGSKFQDGDTLMARITPCLENGKISRYKAKLNDCLVGFGSTEFLVIRGKPSVTDNDFAYYLTQWDEFQNFAISQMTGSSGRQRVPVSALSHFFVNLPPLPVQKKIAAILSSLDDKIEINTRMNKVLEETARTLFHRWFVEFEFPNDEGKPYKSSGGRMIASEMGEIPEGWSVGSLRDLVTFSYGKPLKENERRGGPYPVFGSNGIVGWHNKWLVEGPGIIVGRKGNPGVVKWSSYNFYPIDTTFYVVPFSKDYGLHYLYSLLEKLQLSRLSADSAVPGLNRDAALKQQILIPQKQIVEKYEKIAESLNLQKKTNDEESRSLSKSRDILLDHLLKPSDL